MIVVLIIGMLAMVAVPNVKRALETSRYNTIIANLRTIDMVKTQWAAENKKAMRIPPSQEDLAPYFSGQRFPVSVVGETYNINTVGQARPQRLREAERHSGGRHCGDAREIVSTATLQTATDAGSAGWNADVKASLSSKARPSCFWSLKLRSSQHGAASGQSRWKALNELICESHFITSAWVRDWGRMHHDLSTG
jgi:hypothetical protein